MSCSSCSEECYSYEKIQAISNHILASTKHRPKIGIICGSGLGVIADTIVDCEILPYESIPNFPVTSISFHAGKMILGLMAGIPVVCLQGRSHYYEGHPLWKCTLCVRVLKLMGINNVIITCATGALNQNFKIGDIMVMKDHVNFLNLGGNSPLRGLNDPRFGPQFVSMINTYDRDLRKKAKEIAEERGFSEHLKEGIHTMATGPMYETAAEMKVLETMGIDTVGMSTIPEVIVARHCGMRIFTFALITNVCILDTESIDVTHVDVCQVGNESRNVIQQLVTGIIEEMAKEAGNASSF